MNEWKICPTQIYCGVAMILAVLGAKFFPHKINLAF